MDKLLKSISYIFHPLLMPLLGVIFYFSKSPRYIPIEIIKAKLISLFILTIIIPVLLYFLLKTVGIAKTINLETTRERRIPLILNGILVLIILDRILTPSESIELYFFFVGILISNMACVLLALFKFKASIHMRPYAAAHFSKLLAIRYKISSLT